MDYTSFGYTVLSTLRAVHPLTAKLTCAEIVRRRIRLKTRTWSLSLPDQTIVHPTGLIPLYAQNDVHPISFSLNCAGVCHIMSGFGANDCSTISHEIDETLRSMSSEGRGIAEVKILKITTKVYEIDSELEKLLIERYGSVPVDDSRVIGLLGCNSNGSNGCVICMEDYIEGSIVAKLPCDHDFHGVCINKRSQIKRQCPLCQIQIPPLSSFSFFLWILEL